MNKKNILNLAIWPFLVIVFISLIGIIGYVYNQQRIKNNAVVMEENKSINHCPFGWIAATGGKCQERGFTKRPRIFDGKESSELFEYVGEEVVLNGVLTKHEAPADSSDCGFMCFTYYEFTIDEKDLWKVGGYIKSFMIHEEKVNSWHDNILNKKIEITLDKIVLDFQGAWVEDFTYISDSE